MLTFSVRWIYVLDKDYVYNIIHRLPSGWNEGYAFIDKKGNRRLEIHPNGDLKVVARYAWDGCTPKFKVFDFLIGTPDGAPNNLTKKPKTYYASLVHDALYQFLEINPSVSKLQADKIFRELLSRDGFAPRNIYYFFVVIFGGLSHRFTRRKRAYDGKRIQFTPEDLEPYFQGG
jgi:hypothetical protein